MRKVKIHQFILYFTALVWLANGFLAKVLNLVPRHQQIVESILSIQDGRALTMLIGFSEILMAIWILSKIASKLNTIAQIGIVLLMNIIEQFIAGDQLLWGKFNFIFAVLFCSLIAYNEFVIKKNNNSISPLKNADA